MLATFPAAVVVAALLAYAAPTVAVGQSADALLRSAGDAGQSGARTDERAKDVGATLRRVDALRAEARYDDAADELRGLIERWNSPDAIGGPNFFVEGRRMEELMRTLVALENAKDHADDNPAAARRFLSLLVDPAKPSGRTVEQVRALLLVAKHDDKARALIDAAFPARVVIEVNGDTPDPALQEVPFEDALVEVSQHELPIVTDVGQSVLRVRLTVVENDRHNSLLEGTAMKSYAMHMSAVIEGADGVVLIKAATTTSALGINPGYAARYGMARCAQLIYAQLVDELARRIARG